MRPLHESGDNCQKEHIVDCFEGEVINELEDQDASLLKAGMNYIVSDDLSSHRSVTKEGVKLLVIDGEFLTSNQA